MPPTWRLAVLPGEGIGPEVIDATLEVLGRAAEDRALADRDTGGQAHVPLERGPGPDPAPVADHHVGTDDRERADLDLQPELRAGIDERRRVNAGGHRSTTAAIISASTATLPST